LGFSPCGGENLQSSALPQVFNEVLTQDTGKTFDRRANDMKKKIAVTLYEKPT
jgi:hypothetical protein